jgi:hypothetical protein
MPEYEIIKPNDDELATLDSLRQELIDRHMNRLERAVTEANRLESRVRVITAVKYEPDWIYFREFGNLNRN